MYHLFSHKRKEWLLPHGFSKQDPAFPADLSQPDLSFSYTNSQKSTAKTYQYSSALSPAQSNLLPGKPHHRPHHSFLTAILPDASIPAFFWETELFAPLCRKTASLYGNTGSWQAVYKFLLYPHSPDHAVAADFSHSYLYNGTKYYPDIQE